ncbi:hypothetical protein [Micromonospora sp. WMMD975]|uniref:hypothetical protein n=1 Tax=Micromonospora sp. WMMD975 TaxID=3016087 RepID=UPI00249CAE77|nr:hypothetical protein [Micromonospora sp. WMMD975]WFE32413.1 hypothetical protein O7613_22965 [Micromonospora sp. WMMD975]
MSELPPSGAEPVPPVDPTRPPSPPADPWAPADPWSGPAADQPGPVAADQPGSYPAVPHQPGYGLPSGSGPQGTPPGWPAPQGTAPSGFAPDGAPSGWSAPQGAPPGWSAPQGAPPGWSAPQGAPSGWSAPQGAPSGWSAPDGWHWPAAGAPGSAYPGHPMPGSAYPGHPMPGAAYPAWPMPGGHPGWYPGLDPQDPLVTPPHAGVGGWFARCAGAVRRGWRHLVPIMLLTQAVPAAVISVVSLFLVPTDQMAAGPDGAPVLPDGYLEQTLAFYGVVLLATLVFGPLQAVGWAAGTWVVARQAAGAPVGLGGAFRYGARRALGLWGWTIVASLLITFGACFCLLPGVYAGFAVALFGPVHLFERQDPIGRSWRLFHRSFGMVLGRVALVACALLAAAVLDVVVGAVSGAVFGADPTTAPGTTVGAVALAVVGAALAAPAYLAQLVGLVVAYAEQRAQEGPVNAARLAAELG